MDYVPDSDREESLGVTIELKDSFGFILMSFDRC